MKDSFNSELPNYFDKVSYGNNNVISNQKAVNNNWSNYFFLKNPKINYQFSNLRVYPKAHECSFMP